jgi:hypothetical protein
LAVPQCSPHCKEGKNNFFHKLTKILFAYSARPPSPTNKNKNVMYKAGKYERNVKFLTRM